jgi:hypothetical protein
MRVIAIAALTDQVTQRARLSETAVTVPPPPHTRLASRNRAERIGNGSGSSTVR